ncbi:MAG: hypothetical protein PHH69_04685 [Candidatus Omnitrophica bacterium]|nr:hypothetical protein [Candidatus Omnitrophota bacterium]MDD5610819.1 hypothetical protein [Candidatus Omnitrophota bacterium]
MKINRSGQVVLEWVVIVLICATVALSVVKKYAKTHMQDMYRKNVNQFSQDLYDRDGTWSQNVTRGDVGTSTGLKVDGNLFDSHYDHDDGYYD